MNKSEPDPFLSVRRKKIVFLAWGYSIHAQRRIQIFADDPLFDVTVVSTYNYRFSGATTILLSQAQSAQNTEHSSGSKGGFFSHHPLLLKTMFPFSLILKFMLELINLERDYFILKRTIKEKKPDVIFLQTLLYPCYLILLIRNTAPVIITFWNGDVTWWAKWTGIERLLKKQIIIQGVKRAVAITVNSTEALNACIQYGKSAQNIHLIRYPGVDLSRFYPIDKESAKKHIGNDAKKIVFWPRGIAKYLNFDTLVTASQIVLTKYPDIHFIILFANKEIDHSIQEDLKAKGMEKNYSLVNKIRFEDMPYYYAAADMMVSISSNDSLPNTMLEAMACGCPVIMGDIPQIRNWVVDGENGYLCPVNDPDRLAECIIKVIEDPQKLNEKFIRGNMARIKQDLDSRKMEAEIKKLIISISSKPTEVTL
nr:glycosyltransferase family 4 protein [uncultured Methanoregula sp.]